VPYVRGLLVVMGIIVVLTGFLLTPVHRAESKARQAQCINNRRQLAIGVLSYEADAGILPPNHEGIDFAPGLTNWVMGNMAVPADRTTDQK
jgi:hypothetical protein